MQSIQIKQFESPPELENLGQAIAIASLLSTAGKWLQEESLKRNLWVHVVLLQRTDSRWYEGVTLEIYYDEDTDEEVPDGD